MIQRRLGVNVDHVATIRQARRTVYPDPVIAANIAEQAGAHQITVHLREDRRHIQERDVQMLRQSVETCLNLEMAATNEMLESALELKPDVITSVPERREELTTEGGLDVIQHYAYLKQYVQRLRDAGFVVSLFIDPDIEQIRASHRIDVPMVELHTGSYACARPGSATQETLQRVIDAAKACAKLGMRVAAGHGLHYHNVAPLVLIEEIEEYNIGHAIVARAMMCGFDKAVRDMLGLLCAPSVE